MATVNGGMEPRSRVQPSLLLRQLDELWSAFGKGAQESSDGGVVRACSLTWITVVEGDEATVSQVDEMLAGVMRVHPSRAIVVLLRKGDERSMKGSVSAQCWRPFGSKQQVCIERVLLESTVPGACDLPAVIRALLVADLPVVLFCRDADLLKLEGIRETSLMADRVVVDMAFRDSECPRLWPTLPGFGRFVSDLAWDRIIEFRRGVARYFESESHRQMLGSFTRLRVSTRPEKPTPEAAYLLSWVLNSLGFERQNGVWQRGDQAVEAGFSADGAPGEPVSALEFQSPRQTFRLATSSVTDASHPTPAIPVGATPGDTALLTDEMVVEYRRRTFEQFLPETIRLFKEPHYFVDE